MTRDAACDHDWVISSVVPDTRVCVRCNATEPTPEPTPILVAPDAAFVPRYHVPRSQVWEGSRGKQRATEVHRLIDKHGRWWS